ncbi:MAG TPA: carboxypeptidase regulatory-like domain-containing protein, partial [Bryobacteraceae bacterium]|nr:carboxypeptidase regulatory-like domain-containing protein [Bryobacteraceae bacterium]
MTDPSGAAIPGAKLVITNSAQGFKNTTIAGAKGAYTFPSLPVGRFELHAEAQGFKPQTRSNIGVDLDAVVKIDLALEVAPKVEEVTVTAEDTRVETESTQVGEVVTARSIAAVALNGRSFTDLLALQPGIVPMTTQLPDSIVMAGASVAIPPSGTLNAGNQSISGQREDANGFMVNGGDVKELMNGGTMVAPNLDSIAEFRILTNNFDAEYGNYSGGIVNVVTKSGSNALHGDAFEFFRNTDLDARNFFSPERSFYRQNQFGGTIGGPIRENQAFYFADYQGTRQSQGIDTGLIPVPAQADRGGDLADEASALTGSVSGPYFAGLLAKALGYPVSANEPYYSPGCVTVGRCVFPGARIPMNAWSSPARHLLQYIPTPNLGASTFSTGEFGSALRDDKTSLRIDSSSDRWGLFSAYYFFDDYNLNNPYPTGQGGASVPGFAALNLGRAQLADFAHTKTFG